MVTVVILLLTLLVLAVIWCLLLSCRREHPSWAVLKQYRYAHRGYHQKPAVPENSMAAFRAALERGWGVELDVHLMKDGNLAVIHDASLKRTAGADAQIEDLTKADLANYTLEESFEHIPLLEHVLAIFEGKAPLIIELKPERGNHTALSKAVVKALEQYKGDYCIESFDPRVVQWFRKNCPGICRGQLAENFMLEKKSSLNPVLKFALSNLLLNIGTRPDFVAYRFDHRKNLSLRLCRAIWKPAVVHWTITSQADLQAAEAEGAVPIFECFDPEVEG